MLVHRGTQEAQDIAVTDNKLYIDVNQGGSYSIGFVGYTVEGENKVYQISTNLEAFYIDRGAGEIETISKEISTPTEWELYLAQIQKIIKQGQVIVDEANNLDIDAEKTENKSIITVTKKDGSKKSVEIFDGNNEGGGSTSNYEDLKNKPKINDIELRGNKTLEELGIQPKGEYLKQETDPTVPQHVKDISEEDIEYWNNRQEKDPTVPQHVKNISEEDIEYWNNKSEFSGSYNDLKNKPNLEQMEADLKAYTDNEIATFDFIKIVQELPEIGLPNRTYFVAKANTDNNDLYDEYMWINEKWEPLGTKQIEVDLTNCLKKDEVKEEYFEITYEDGTTKTVRSVVFK